MTNSEPPVSRRAIATLLALFSINHATAQPAERQVGRVVSGLTVVVQPDGQLNFRGEDSIRLDNGRVLRRSSEGKWAVDPPLEKAAELKIVKAADFAVFWEDFIGERVRIVDGRLHAVDTDSSMLSIPGRSVSVEMTAVARPVLRTLIERCGSISINTQCRIDVTGTEPAAMHENRKWHT